MRTLIQDCDYWQAAVNKVTNITWVPHSSGDEDANLQGNERSHSIKAAALWIASEVRMLHRVSCKSLSWGNAFVYFYRFVENKFGQKDKILCRISDISTAQSQIIQMILLLECRYANASQQCGNWTDTKQYLHVNKSDLAQNTLPQGYWNSHRPNLLTHHIHHQNNSCT
jgi:hypothetical protein